MLRLRSLRRPVLRLALLLAVAGAGCENRAAHAPAPVVQPPAASVPPAPGLDIPLPKLPPPPDLSGLPLDGVRVALLVPLSGPNAALGTALLDAAQLAVFEHGDERFLLLPRDTGGTPESAAAAMKLALRDGARLVVGPIFAADTAAAAPEARTANVPVLSFSNDRSVAGPGVWTLGLAPGPQVARVVEFARSRGLSRYAALLPANAYGAAVEQAFRETAARVGAEIAAIERYDTGADATPVVRRIAQYDQRRAALQQQRRQLEAAGDEISRQALRRLEGVETIGEVGFDALLLPDSGDRLLALAPLLPYYDVGPARVRFLGTAQWDDPRVAREPALAGGWFAAPPPEARAAFTARYKEVYGRDPPPLAAIAYDAVAAAAVLARAEGGPNLTAAALTNPVGFAGMNGVFRLLPDGTVERNLAVLEVRRTGFRTVSPAPESFETPTQ